MNDGSGRQGPWNKGRLRYYELGKGQVKTARTKWGREEGRQRGWLASLEVPDHVRPFVDMFRARQFSRHQARSEETPSSANHVQRVLSRNAIDMRGLGTSISILAHAPRPPQFCLVECSHDP